MDDSTRFPSLPTHPLTPQHFYPHHQPFFTPLSSPLPLSLLSLFLSLSLSFSFSISLSFCIFYLYSPHARYVCCVFGRLSRASSFFSFKQINKNIRVHTHV